MVLFKGLIGFLICCFLLGVIVLMLTGGYIVRTIRKMRKAAMQAADEQARQYRDETRRKRHQYSQKQQAAANQDAATDDTNSTSETDYADQPRQTKTATGETIIDHRHQQREDRKIFDDTDGEYVEFTEES